MVALAIEDVPLEAGADTAVVATTQRDAIRLAADERPDFLTADVRLPDGSGPAAVQGIHSRYGDIPVLFITAIPEACVPCAPPGSVLAKPFRSSAVAAAFHSLKG